MEWWLLLVIVLFLFLFLSIYNCYKNYKDPKYKFNRGLYSL